MPTSRISSTDLVFAALAGLVGLLARLPAPLRASFPLNDGGLFYQMILDLQAHHLALPMYVSYNSESIPFAYPPLIFYLVAAVASALRLDVLILLRLLPPVVSSLCVPAFYFPARRILAGRQETVLAATLAFALIPRAFEWHIMGGGITRSFGLLFLLITLFSAHQLVTSPSIRTMILTSVWGSLTVLSHPEAAAQGALAVGILYIVLDRSRRGLLYCLGTALLITALTSPWWGTVLLRYGPAPFLAATAAARQGTAVDFGARIFLTFQFNFTEEPYLPLIGMFGLLGLFAELSKRRWLLPIWVIAPLFYEPRSAPQFMAIPLGMLAGVGLLEVVWPALRGLAAQEPRSARLVTGGFLAYLFVYLVLSAYLVGAKIADVYSLHAPDLAALAWVRQNTGADSRFVILTGANAVADPWAEWFPALAQRKSLNTVFGTEWIRSVSFGDEIRRYDSLQDCLSKDASCLQAWERDTGLGFTHVLIRKSSASAALLQSLHVSSGYREIFETSDIAIFQVIP